MNFAGESLSFPVMILFPLLVGGAYGYASTKGQFCMNSGFSNVTRHGDTTKLKSFIVAILIQMTVLPLLFAILHRIAPGDSFIHWVSIPQTFLFANIVGGFMFGVFMYYSAGCGAGVFYKIGEKNAGSILAALGFVVGVYMIEIGFLKDLRESSHQIIFLEQSPIWKFRFSYLFTGLLSLGSAIGLYFMFRLGDKKPKKAVWGWKKTGITIGVIALLAWGAAALAHSSFGLSIIPGALEMSRGNLSWAVWLLLGIPAGALIGTEKSKQLKFTRPRAKLILRRIFGGLGLGIFGGLAAGCTVGHGLTFTPFLAIGSIVTIFSIFLGSGLMGYLTRK